MQRTLIKDLLENVGTVKICGWVHTLRKHKNIQFLVIRDRTGLVQCINERSVNPELEKGIEGLTPESAVEIIGSVVLNPVVKLGGIEIAIKHLKVVNLAETPLPLQCGEDAKKNRNDETRLDWRFLDLRREENLVIFEIQTALEHAMREFWEKDKFIEIHSPKIMAQASESGAELFRLASYFNREACLAQSPQFYKQMAIAAGFERVFEIGPVFRAEPSFTTRHATEFTSVDVELAWVESHEDVMSWEERWLSFCFSRIAEKYLGLVKKLFNRTLIVPDLPFPRITMQEAHKILSKQGYVVQRSNGDLDPEGERRLCNFVEHEYGHEFVFVTRYPISVRPFYHLRPDENPKLTNSFDLLYRGVEITTGAQREHRFERLKSQAVEKGLDTESIKDYLNYFRYGCPPHGGFGLGLARLLMLMLNLKSIRDSTLLFRGPNRLTP